MAAQTTHIRMKEPRRLENKETCQSLQQWKMQFRQYVKQDDHYRTFIASDVGWNPHEVNYGFSAEQTGLKRTASILKDDCQDFLHTLATFLPHGYLTDKIVTTATSFNKAFEIIEEHYGLLPTQESFMELESFTKQSGESYRQFYERILAYVRQHSKSDENVMVEGVSCQAGGDKISVSHANLITLMWLRKIHPELISIIKTEYSMELRDNKPLASLVPRISVNIDNLLAKYDKAGQVNLIQPEDENDRQVIVNKTYVRRNFNKNTSRAVNTPFCPGCFKMSKDTNIKLHFQHKPSECPKQAMVKLLQMDDIVDDMDQIQVDEIDGKYDELSNEEYNELVRQVSSDSFQHSPQPCFTINIQEVEAMISTIRSKISGFRKESSPTLHCVINRQNVICIIDEGSVINCCSYSFAKRAGIAIDSVQCSAIGANKSPMNVAGIAKHDINAIVLGTNSSSLIRIATMIVINDLGTDILLGQPSKIDNKIITVPHASKIHFQSLDGRSHTVSYPLCSDKDMKLYDVLKVEESVTVFPQENYTYELPNQFLNQKRVCVTERPSRTPWIGCQIVDVKDGCLTLTNKTQQPLYLKKHEHIGDIRNITQVEDVLVNKIIDKSDDCKHLEGYEDWDISNNFLDDIQIDPDNTMTEEWKDKFRSLCLEFEDIINYRPGRYNGLYGDVDNTIEFASIPPITKKIYMPKYSDRMNQILATKMDQLEQWKVLAKPEDVGVAASFVCSSLLVPKDDTGDWRLITNFTPLNKFVKKPPNSAPTIEETKIQLSKFKHIVSLDLANFYYQNGMRTRDIQYLATNHPFKGIRVYTCEPQGLRGASEHSYERLSRIYGSLCQEGKMARQADGLFVGGQTLEELLANLREVFQRTRNCGFTLKPSKVIINPTKIVLFGWMRNNGGWEPTEHTITPMARAETPKTVRQLRSFLGAIKQLSACIKDYAILLSPLEKVAAGKNSSEVIVWNDELQRHFEDAKKSLSTITTFFTPRPDDKIHTFSDWSQSHGAVGGRMEIYRTKEDGTNEVLHGGFFSAKVSRWQSRWLPCEGEALAARMVLQHFKPQLRNSDTTIIHHTDSLPTCHAWQKSKTGAFSTSARIAAFLTEISTLDIEFVHNPGRKMEYSDYASRNAATCKLDSCQICSYLQDLVFTADNMVRSIKIEDIERGNVAMPFTQQNAWRQAQSQDKTLQMLLSLINTGQVPEKKKTCSEYTTLKLLHNLYCKGLLKVSNQGLITVIQNQENGQQTQAIVVPTNLFPGLAHSLHLKTMHASKLQLQRLMSRYFYSVGHQRMIGEVVDNCHTCLSVKQLPKELFPETTGEIQGFGSHFACDVMVRNSQKILWIREKLTQFTHARILDNDTGEDTLKAIVSSIADKIPDYGTTIRTDNASTFQKINALSTDRDSWLCRFNISLELGETFNRNHNPIAENLIKEAHKEINKAGFGTQHLDEFQLSLVVRNINSRIRNRGLSAKEMCYMRDQATNKNITHNDVQLTKEQREMREKTHNKATPLKVEYAVGDNVMIKDKVTKLKPREKFIVVEPNATNSHAIIQKQNEKFLTRQYSIPKHQLFKLPRAAAVKARERIRKLAPLNQLQTVQDGIPLHAFVSSNEEDDEDILYYTFHQPDVSHDNDLDSDVTDSSLSTVSNDFIQNLSEVVESSNSTISNVSLDSLNGEESIQTRKTSHLEGVNENTRFDIQEANLEEGLPIESNEYFSRTQKLDEIIQSTSAFLSSHPRPPAGFQSNFHRQPRLKRVPARFQDFVMDEEGSNSKDRKKKK